MTATRTSIFRFADIEVREREYVLLKAGVVSPVEPKAFRVLLILLRNPQKLIAKEELLNAVWGDAAVTENSLTRSIALLHVSLGMTLTTRVTSRRLQRWGTDLSVKWRRWKIPPVWLGLPNMEQEPPEALQILPLALWTHQHVHLGEGGCLRSRLRQSS
jgi:hypothetical protein